MAQNFNLRVALFLCGASSWMIAGSPLRAAEPADTRQQLERLQEQNKLLQDQLRQQQATIDSLSRTVATLQQTTEQLGRNPAAANSITEPDVPARESGFGPGQVRISAEGGVLFWDSGSGGMAPNSEFRIDEARIFLESPVVDSVYAFVELNAATREEPDVQLRLGEAYLDFENVSRFWHQDHLLSVRLGRFYTPFGEEYQTRYAIDNPLISHSLSDLWAVDEGIELYGSLGKLSYCAAVQNGSIPDTRDADGDKSVAARLGFDPIQPLHLSLSAMRTGNLDRGGDVLSAMWFGNGFFRSLGPAATTTRFHADLLEGDLEWRLPHGHLHAFGGYVHYDDNDSAANNRRDVYYYAIEGVHDLTRKLYAGARFSQIFAHKGFPIVGNGDMGQYLFGALTEQIWRLSLGAGYRCSQNLLFKAEYTLEGGKTTSGENRDHENLVALEAAFKF